MKPIAGVLAVAALFPMQLMSCQSRSDTVAVITKLEGDSIKADLASDPTWAEEYLADDWVGCDSDGKWYSKPEILKIMADTKNNNYKSEKVSDLTIRVYRSTAVATYKDTYDALVEGEPRERSILSTDVWIKVGANWRQVSWQGTTTK